MTLHIYKKLGCAIALGMIAFCVAANQVPHPYKTDARNTWVSYRAHDVVSITLPFNDTLTVYLGDDEIIDDTSFHVAASKELNMSKPLPNSHTLTFSVTDATVPAEITFNTNLHTYVFRIKGDAHAPEIYTLTFKYPNISTKPAYAPFIAKPSRKKLNRLYWYAGDKALKPEAVWDDGFFTYFKFNRHIALPSIYSVYDSIGDEELENSSMVQNGQLVEVRTVAREFTLRLGDEWVSILNQGYTNG